MTGGIGARRVALAAGAYRRGWIRQALAMIESAIRDRVDPAIIARHFTRAECSDILRYSRGGAPLRLLGSDV